MAACQNNGGVFTNVYSVFPEILGRNPFDVDKRSEINLQVILFSQVVIGRLFGFGFRLSD
jgi:hypothetical protein